MEAEQSVQIVQITRIVQIVERNRTSSLCIVYIAHDVQLSLADRVNHGAALSPALANVHDAHLSTVNTTRTQRLDRTSYTLSH